MEWFKHKTASHDDPDISDCEDIYGDAGYAVFFKICEVYGQEYSQLKNGWLNVSQSFIKRKLRKSWTKVEKILNFYQEIPKKNGKESRILYKVEYGRVSVKIPKFIELASNWSKRNKTTPTEATTVSPTAIDLDLDLEVDLEVDKDKSFKSFWNLYHKITGLPKTDYKNAKMYFNRLNKTDQQKATDNIQEYFDCLPIYETGKPTKKARTYLSDRNFDDEFKPQKKLTGII